MPKRTKNEQNTGFLYSNAANRLNSNHLLIQLEKHIPWAWLESNLLLLYTGEDRPIKPIRLMVGLLLLQQMKQLTDERLISRWAHDPYYQVFCGMPDFNWKLPCSPADLAYFRECIGDEGLSKINEALVKARQLES